MVETSSAAELPDIRLGVVRGVSYGLFGKPDEFVPQARALGAGLLRAYVYWGQVEPTPGEFVWDSVDALLEQLNGTDGTDGAGGVDGAGGDQEVWITVCSSSLWATRQSTDFLPPSPARDVDAYAEFVRRLVARCAGRVRYWQCDNEPSNIGLTWAGTAEEYVTQLRALHRAVRDTDPEALVVLGGCGYDVLSSPEGSAPRQFFDHLVSAGRDAFDLFSVHLYGDPARIPDYVETARALMRAHGYLKPVVAGEYAGPVLFEFPELDAVLQETMASAFSEAPANQSLDELAERVGEDTPERRAMAALYARMPELPPRLQMFMAGCAPELEARRHRINCRQIVMRNVLALAGGVHRTAYWNLAPEIPGAGDDPYQMMHLMFGKLPLLDYEDGALLRRYPAAETFALLAEHLAGTRRVTRVEVPDQPTVYAFEVDRDGRGPLLVLWDHRDPFDGEDAPAVPVTWPWRAAGAVAVDALGAAQPIDIRDGLLRLHVSITPVLVHAEQA